LLVDAALLAVSFIGVPFGRGGMPFTTLS
jgi:hypothetical protein